MFIFSLLLVEVSVSLSWPKPNYWPIEANSFLVNMPGRRLPVCLQLLAFCHPPTLLNLYCFLGQMLNFPFLCLFSVGGAVQGEEGVWFFLAIYSFILSFCIFDCFSLIKSLNPAECLFRWSLWLLAAFTAFFLLVKMKEKKIENWKNRWHLFQQLNQLSSSFWPL